jgi:hypothetical protein
VLWRRRPACEKRQDIITARFFDAGESPALQKLCALRALPNSEFSASAQPGSAVQRAIHQTIGVVAQVGRLRHKSAPCNNR